MLLFEDGSECKSDNQCGNGSYCKYNRASKTSTCAKYAVEGAECLTFEDPNLLCQTGFTCKQYGTDEKEVCVMNYSLEDGTIIPGSYYDGINTKVCKSGTAFQKADSTYACGTVKSVSSCENGDCSVTVSFSDSEERTNFYFL